MKKKLLVILGAGSSIPCGLPSGGDLDRCMMAWSRRWAEEESEPDYFAVLWKSIEEYYARGNSRLHTPLNFEKALGDMVALAHWMEPPPWGDTLREIACDGAEPPRLKSAPPHGQGRYGTTIAVTDQLTFLLAKLAQHMRELCRNLQPTSDAARSYAAILDGLRSDCEVGIYNLNYDTAAISAWAPAYTGFNETGAFEPSRIHERAKWDFIYHLHGSVHYSLVSEFAEEICWRRDLNESFFDGHEGYANDKRSEGRSFPKTTLVAGGFKLDQLLVEPFHSMHSALVRHVYAADAVLVAGYGFGDAHLNRALRNRLGVPGRRPRVMVLDFANDNTNPMQFRDDLWTHELCHTLATDGWFFREPGLASPRPISELKREAGFEVDADHGVAIWYGGFIDAGLRLDSILSWLGGASDDVLAGSISLPT